MRRLVQGHRTRLVGLVPAVSLAAAGSITAATPPAQAASAVVTASVSVDAGRTLASIPATGVGMNVAVYDGNMNHPSVPGLLKDAGVGMVRCPGGSYADGYHWQTHTVEGGYVAPNTDFDTFMGTARADGAQPIITADYGSGTPEEAAGWVRYANDPTVYSYLKNATSIGSTTAGSATHQTLPPYSIVVVQLHRQ